MTPDNIEELDNQLLAQFKGRCALHLWHKAVCIHEIEPRSQRPTDWWEPGNRIPLCDEAHRLVHQEGTAAWASRLHEARRRALQILNPGRVDQ